MKPIRTIITLFALTSLGMAGSAAADTLKEGEIACRSERAIVLFEELEQKGDRHQQEMLVGTACMRFEEGMEAQRIEVLPEERLVRIRITNGRRKVELWTRPESLDVAVS